MCKLMNRAELSRASGISLTTCTKILKQMEAAGMVYRWGNVRKVTWKDFETFMKGAKS